MTACEITEEGLRRLGCVIASTRVPSHHQFGTKRALDLNGVSVAIYDTGKWEFSCVLHYSTYRPRYRVKAVSA